MIKQLPLIYLEPGSPEPDSEEFQLIIKENPDYFDEVRQGLIDLTQIESMTIHRNYLYTNLQMRSGDYHVVAMPIDELWEILRDDFDYSGHIEL